MLHFECEPEPQKRDVSANGYTMDPSWLMVIIPDPRSGGLGRSAAYLDEIKAQKRKRKRIEKYDDEGDSNTGTFRTQTKPNEEGRRRHGRRQRHTTRKHDEAASGEKPKCPSSEFYIGVEGFYEGQ